MKHFRHEKFWGTRSEGAAGWTFSIWAPEADTVSVMLKGDSYAMLGDAEGHWSLTLGAEAGQHYWFVIDGTAYPDPASRMQSEGVHGASVLCPQPSRPNHWAGRDWAEAVVFEMHLGTFTPEGTLRRATEKLQDLADAGFTFIELMPIAQFHGRFGWGYDGVLPYALHDAYGSYEDLTDFINRAHELDMGVLLDVVYNHFGPEGAYLHAYCPQFFHADKSSTWGASIDFSRPEVRAYFLRNAEMWIVQHGFDGLRLDAVHAIGDDSSPHFVTELTNHLKSLKLGRPVHIIAEDERNLPDLREAGVDAAWNDDYHHAVHCLLTDEDEGYYEAFAADPMADLCQALRGGQVEEGQPRAGKALPRGAPSDHLPVTSFVNANQTHDQVGNRARGERLISLIGTERMAVLHGLLLCGPYVPMLFMGEEVGSHVPFQFFADFDGDLAEAVRKGRAAEFADFAGFTGTVPDPCAKETMINSRPYGTPSDDADFWRSWTKNLLQLRGDKIVPLLKTARLNVQVDQVGPRALRAHWHFAAGTLHIAANLGAMPDDPDVSWAPDLTFNTMRDEFGFACCVMPA